MAAAKKAPAVDNKAIVKRLLTEVFSKGNLAVVDEILAKNFVLHDPYNPQDIKGPEGYKYFAGVFRGAFPDLKTKIEDVICEGDKVVARWTAPGTNKGELMGMPATGKKATFKGVDIMRVVNGKVVEQWTNYNLLSALQDIGAVPRPGQKAAGAS
jgi:steroid delta-isomerase-like uncharacterized protein